MKVKASVKKRSEDDIIVRRKGKVSEELMKFNELYKEN